MVIYVLFWTVYCLLSVIFLFYSLLTDGTELLSLSSCEILFEFIEVVLGVGGVIAVGEFNSGDLITWN